MFNENSSIPQDEFAGAGSQIAFHKFANDFEETKASHVKRLLVLNSMLNAAYWRVVCNLFTNVNHHKNSSVMLITQKSIKEGRFSRDISLNIRFQERARLKPVHVPR